MQFCEFSLDSSICKISVKRYYATTPVAYLEWNNTSCQYADILLTKETVLNKNVTLRLVLSRVDDVEELTRRYFPV